MVAATERDRKTRRLSRSSRTSSLDFESLGLREQGVMKLVAAGLMNKQ